MTVRFNPPPNWPPPPAGWAPPANWQPDPGWPPAPAGWTLWVDDNPIAPVAPAAPSGPVTIAAKSQGDDTHQPVPVASSLRAQTGINAPTSRFRPILYLIAGICAFVMVVLGASSFITDDCTPNGMSYTCISRGSSSVHLQTTLNIPLLIGALILALLLVGIGVRGIRRANQAREHHQQGTP